MAIYPEYKANRERRRQQKLKENLKKDPNFPDDFSCQRDMVYSLMDASNICCRKNSGVEADDIISKIVFDYADKFDDIVIVSSDHDMLQLIRKNVSVLKPSLNIGKSVKEEIIDYDTVVKNYNLPPERLPELWALSGDRSDNIKGAKGIGPSKAAKLIATYGTLDNVLENDEYIKTQKNSVELAYKLIKLDDQEEFQAVTMEDLKFDPTMPGSFKAPQLEELLNKLEFYTVLQDWKNFLFWNKIKIGRKLS